MPGTLLDADSSWRLINISWNCIGPLTRGFFSVVSTSVLYDLRLVESTPTLFKDQLCISPVCTCVLSGFRCVRLLATVWTIAHRAPLSLGFSRQEYWSGLPFPSPGDLPNPGIEPKSPAASALQPDSLPLSQQAGPISAVSRSSSFSRVLEVWDTLSCHSESESDFILLMLKHTWA